MIRAVWTGTLSLAADGTRRDGPSEPNGAANEDGKRGESHHYMCFTRPSRQYSNLRKQVGYLLSFQLTPLVVPNRHFEVIKRCTCIQAVYRFHD